MRSSSGHPVGGLGHTPAQAVVGLGDLEAGPVSMGRGVLRAMPRGAAKGQGDPVGRGMVAARGREELTRPEVPQVRGASWARAARSARAVQQDPMRARMSRRDREAPVARSPTHLRALAESPAQVARAARPARGGSPSMPESGATLRVDLTSTAATARVSTSTTTFSTAANAAASVRVNIRTVTRAIACWLPAL
jgi:hypothetical protein